MSDTSFPESPCIGLCQMDAQRRYCTGCRRTLNEIAGWSTMDMTARRLVLAALDTRGGDPADARPKQRRGLA